MDDLQMRLKDSKIYQVSIRLWPNIATMNKQSQLSAIGVMIPLITLFPFALIGIIWLIYRTDHLLLFEDFLSRLALLVVLLLLMNQPFNISVGVGGNNVVTLTSSLVHIVLWGTVLITGPSGLWIMVAAAALFVFYRRWRMGQFSGVSLFWPLSSQFIQELSSSIFATLLALQLYEAIGGEYPLISTDPAGWIPAFVAIFVGAVIPGILLLPTAIIFNQIASLPNSMAHLGRFFLGAVGLSVLMSPFAVIVALLYAQGRSGLLIFILIAIFLVNWLANHLSRANERSQQQAREFAILEELGEALIKAKPDGTTLSDILGEYLPRMFPNDRAAVHLFDDEMKEPWLPVNVAQPAGIEIAPQSTWDKMISTNQSYVTIPDIKLPDDKRSYGDGLAVKIMASDAASKDQVDAIGGVYLLRHGLTGNSIDSLAAVQSLASQIASAVYRAKVHLETLAFQKMEQELEFAGRIQNSFLPDQVPQVSGWQLTATLEPARQTSGDFYDFIPLEDGRIGILVADVADKGTGAALYMALSRTLIRTFAMQYSDQPALALAKANDRILGDTQSDQFVTVFYGVLDSQSGALTYANAGHNPAYLIRNKADSEVESLMRTGIPLGMFDEMSWNQDQVTLEPGDVLLLYTDGVTEAQDASQALYEDYRLLATSKANLDKNAKEIETAIVESIRDFVGDAPQFDDITLLVVVREIAT